VTFDDYDAVDKAVLEKPHTVNGRNLDVKKAVPKEKMQEESSTNSSPNASGMSSFNRSNSSNYSGGNSGPPPPTPPSSRNNFGQMRDNFGSTSGSWDNQGGMPRMNNQNYNQPQTSSYGQQGGYSTSGSGFNPPMPPTSAYSQPFNSMGQSQPPPPPPLPPMPQQPQPMMNYDMYNNTSNMPFNNNSNQPPSSNYIQPLAQSYGQTQQQGFGTNSNGYGGGMSNPFNIPQQPSSGVGGYSDVSSPATSFDNSGSYGITSQNYSGGNYNNMPQQQSRGGGPMRGGRG
jgi:RNA-binding protein Musashi